MDNICNDLFSTKIPLKAAVDQKTCVQYAVYIFSTPPPPSRSSPLPIISHNSLSVVTDTTNLKSAHAVEVAFLGRLIF